MRKMLMMVVTCAFLAAVGAGLGGCETAPDDGRSKYPSADESARPNSKIPQMGTDFLDDD